MPKRIRGSGRENVNNSASLSRSQRAGLVFGFWGFCFVFVFLTLSRTVMSSVRHRDAPVMPLALCVCSTSEALCGRI